MDRVFKALSNSTRRAICDALRDRPLTTGALGEVFHELDRCTVMQHLRILENAGLVISVRKGRQRFNYLNSTPIQEVHRRWIGPHAERASARLLALKHALEGESAANVQTAEE